MEYHPMRKTFLTAAVAATLGAVTFLPTGADAAPKPTLAEILLSDSDTDDENGFDNRPYDFDIVTQAVLLFPDLVAAASNPDAELTVFLPDDRAFRRLAREFTGEWIRDEAEVFAVVASLGLPTVEAVLTYHIVPDSINLGKVLQSDGAVLPTLSGGTFTVDVQGDPVTGVRLIDNDPNDTDPKVKRANVGGSAANGWAHGIDRVLRPIDLP
ncbi:MAG: fasciclin domain-containing protein [Actinomycetota bacterium]